VIVVGRFPMCMYILSLIYNVVIADTLWVHWIYTNFKLAVYMLQGICNIRVYNSDLLSINKR